MTADMLETVELYKRYRGAERAAVNGISLNVAAGEFFGLLGPNGAGKTTLLSMISGLRQADSGKIRILGEDVAHRHRDITRRIGLVPQELALYQNLTARENLMFFGSMQNLQGEDLLRQVDKCLEIGRLHDHANKRVCNYSGGLKRRLNLAIGLLHEPELLILDEPTIGIDPQSRNFIFESLRNLNRNGMTIIYTTHYMEEVEQLCARVAIMDRGEIIACGPLNELLTRYNNKSVFVRLAENVDENIISLIQQLPGVQSVAARPRELVVNADNLFDSTGLILDTLKKQNLEIVSLSAGSNNLEQVFLQLTGTSLRDHA